MRITAHSPQAKGRVERHFGTLQDRLVKSLRLSGSETLEQANQHLAEEFLPRWKDRFAVKPDSEVDAHRQLESGHDLASIFSHVESRQVGNDYTVSWAGKRWQISREAVEVGLRKRKVRVEERWDGMLWVQLKQGLVELKHCGVERPETAGEEPTATDGNAATGSTARRDHNRGGKSGWMKDFTVQSPHQLA